MSDFKVFYSWQSDLPNATNRGFIGDALEKACKLVEKNPEIQESPRVDQDTQGLPGSPSIPAAIMEKIDECQVFVADVSLCYAAKDGTPSPNPNVAYELGYAVARLGWDRVILVLNEEFGGAELLPFDMEKRRATLYSAKEGEVDRSEAKKALVARLVANIETIAKRQPIVPKRTPADEAIDAIENQLPTRKARIREFWTWALHELHRIEPDLLKSPAPSEELNRQLESLKSALDNSSEVSRLWSRVCEAAALADDGNAAETITGGFEKLLEEYDYKPNWGGGLYIETGFDFWKFVGHELWTVWIGCLLKEGRWALIDGALGESFYLERKQSRTGNGVVSFAEISEFVALVDIEGKNNGRLSFHADLLQARYTENGIGSTLTLDEFIEADLFLFFAGELRLEPGWGGWLRWRPWSVLFIRREPRFLREAARKRYAAGIKIALGETDAEKIREVIRDRLPRLSKLWDNLWRCTISINAIDAFDTQG